MIQQEQINENRASTKSQTTLFNAGTFLQCKSPFIEINLQKYTKSNSIEPSQFVRRDIFGTEIRKGGRTHKVTFVDKITMKEGEPKIAQEIPIENFKVYNANNVYAERPFHIGSEAFCCDSCSII